MTRTLPTREARRSRSLLAEARPERDADSGWPSPAALSSPTVTCPGCSSLALAAEVRDGRCPGCDLCGRLTEMDLNRMADMHPLPT